MKVTIKNIKCGVCIYCQKIEDGIYRCKKRSFMINPKFIRAWGCNDYECEFMSLLDISEHMNDKISIKIKKKGQ